MKKTTFLLLILTLILVGGYFLYKKTILATDTGLVSENGYSNTKYDYSITFPQDSSNTYSVRPKNKNHTDTQHIQEEDSVIITVVNNETKNISLSVLNETNSPCFNKKTLLSIVECDRSLLQKTISEPDINEDFKNDDIRLTEISKDNLGTHYKAVPENNGQILFGSQIDETVSLGYKYNEKKGYVLRYILPTSINQETSELLINSISFN